MSETNGLSEHEALKSMYAGYRGPLSDLPEEARRLLWRAGDLRARWLLNNLAEKVYVPYSTPECAAVASLVHAYHYLADRLSYELHPWPKNMIKLEIPETEVKP